MLKILKKTELSACAVLLITILSALSHAQSSSVSTVSEISTDRPAVTDSSIVVPGGTLQFENGVTGTNDHGTQNVDFSQTLVRWGVARRTELRLTLPDYVHGFSSSASGFSDVVMGMKQQVGPLLHGIDLSVVVSLSLPSGSSQVSTHGVDPFINVPWSKDLGAGWSVAGMQSVFWRTQDFRRNLTWEPTILIDKQPRKQWDIFAEYAGDFPQRGEAPEIAHFGTTYKVTTTQQVDFHFGLGVSHAAPNSFFAAGYSFRINTLASLKP